jgi:hypothetical protein
MLARRRSPPSRQSDRPVDGRNDRREQSSMTIAAPQRLASQPLAVRRVDPETCAVNSRDQQMLQRRTTQQSEPLRSNCKSTVFCPAPTVPFVAGFRLTWWTCRADGRQVATTPTPQVRGRKRWRHCRQTVKRPDGGMSLGRFGAVAVQVGRLSWREASDWNDSHFDVSG